MARRWGAPLTDDNLAARPDGGHRDAAGDEPFHATVPFGVTAAARRLAG